jgi:hypothetical protein
MTAPGLTIHPGLLRRWGLWAAAVAVLAAGGFLAGGGWLVFRSPGADWVFSAVTSRLFVTCAALAAGCGAALVLAGQVLWRAGEVGRSRRRDPQGGSAMIEFVLVLPIALMIVLVMVQSTLLMGGNLCVHYAAYCAARSAIVQIPRWVPDHQAPYEPANQMLDPDASGKYRKIHLAAAYAVMPVACGSEEVPGGDDGGLGSEIERLFGGYGLAAPGWVDDRLARKLSYAYDYTTVELSDPLDGMTYGEHEDIRVSVRHTLYLSVPYASRIFTDLDDDGVRLGFGRGNYGMNIRATCVMPNEGPQDYVDRERFPQIHQSGGGV